LMLPKPVRNDDEFHDTCRCLVVSSSRGAFFFGSPPPPPPSSLLLLLLLLLLPMLRRLKLEPARFSMVPCFGV
jgi:hypothetical protein